MAIVGGHNADHLKAIFPPGLLIGHLLPGAITAVWRDVECGGKGAAAPGLPGKNPRHQRITVVQPGSINKGLNPIRPPPPPHQDEPYLSSLSIRWFWHNII